MKNYFKNIVLCILLAISVIIMFAFVSCSNQKKPVVIENTDKEVIIPTETPKMIYAINDEVQLNDVSITVLGVKKSNGTAYSKPKPGYEFVVVNVLIKNVGGTEAITYNPFDFSMKNSKGQIVQETFTTINTNTRLSSGKLILGGEISGTLVYEQTKDDKSLTLIYKPSYWSDSVIEVSLN